MKVSFSSFSSFLETVTSLLVAMTKNLFDHEFLALKEILFCSVTIDEIIPINPCTFSFALPSRERFKCLVLQARFLCFFQVQCSRCLALTAELLIVASKKICNEGKKI